MSKVKKERGLIVALDKPNLEEIRELAKRLNGAEGNFALKVGRTLEQAFGANILTLLGMEAPSLPIIYDGKIADIPYISCEIAKQAYECGADAVIMQGFVGPDVIEALVNLQMGDVIVVASMTHPGSQYHIDKHVGDIVAEAAAMKANGLVLPATRSEIISTVAHIADGEGMYIISPGIKAQGAQPGDAIRAGADYEVVGRAIYNAEDPARAAMDLYEQIR